jgi:hypothetical protein
MTHIIGGIEVEELEFDEVIEMEGAASEINADAGRALTAILEG